MNFYKDQLVIRTIVSPAWKKKQLFVGTFLSFVGIFFLIYVSVYIPAPLLSGKGILFYLISITFVAIGLIPYRRLQMREEKPDRLIFTDEGLVFFTPKIKILTIPYEAILSYWHYDDGVSFGINIILKGQAKIHDPYFDFQKVQKRCRDRFHSDLFFGNFSARSFRSLLAECRAS